MAISRKIMFARIVIYVSSIGLLLLGFLAGCGGAATQRKKPDFFTSGSKEADQRATQRMARSEQVQGSGGAGGGQKGAQTEGQKTLYERLGGEAGMKAIVDDFVNRAIADPRVNWQRKGVRTGNFIRSKSAQWDASPANVEQLKKHIVQFLSIATGGPAFYDGREIKEAHTGMKITNAEFDASVGDLKAALDKLAIPSKEQRELLSIIESTRPQVAEQR